jgi:membrane associated rhomboid family serine protease
MLEDRPYMRRTSFDARRSATVLLLIVNVVAFLAQIAVGAFSHFRLNHYFALSLDGLRHGYVWQLLTFQFMHGGIFHLLFNCLAIFWFGRPVEDAVGRKSFWTLYFLSGVIGGLVQVAGGLVLSTRFNAPVVGASAGAFGLVAAFATLFPDRILTLLLFFVIPVNMRARLLLLFEAAVAVIGIVFPSDNIAHAAHLGGMLAGIGFIRYGLNWTWPTFRSGGRKPLRRLVQVHSQKAAPWGQAARNTSEDLPPDEFLSKEVDPILDKISAHGIQSLTERERRILEAATRKIGKR